MIEDLFAVAQAAAEAVVKIMETKFKDVHESEWNWAGYPVDYIIDNNGTLEDLSKQIDSIRDWKTGKFKEHLKIV